MNGIQTIDIEYFKKLLEDRRKQIYKNMNNVHSELEALNGCEVNDELDEASLKTGSFVEEVLRDKQNQELKEIEIALEKIKKGTYNICEMCGEPIGILRLKVKPQAKYCIQCRPIAEQKTNTLKKAMV